jgi:multidrug efflux system outer membrane protein
MTAASCMVGPDYRRPAQHMPAAYRSPTTRAAATQPALTADWWRLFGDPKLNELEDAALRANTDLRAAMARVMQARAAARITASQFYPTITLDPSVVRSRSAPHTTSNLVQIPFDLSYEIDVWGRVRRAYQASVAQARASENDYQVVRLTLAADVAQDYLTLRSLDAQDQILVKSVESFRKQVSLTQTLFRAGLAAQTDVLQAQTQLDSTLTQEIEVRRQRADLEHALAILLGRPPTDLALAAASLDLSIPAIPAGLPADLLRRRPDVAEAEQNLVAASAQIGVATAQFYPTISLIGAAGFESLDLKHSLDWKNRVWSIGPSVSVPIFEGGQLKAGLAQAKARYDELTATYRGTVLGAIRDVEDSLTDLHHFSDEATAQQQAVQSSRESLRLSQVQYERGLIAYLQVIDAERTLLANELSASQILNQRMVSTVLLIKALGGGWEVTQPAP